MKLFKLVFIFAFAIFNQIFSVEQDKLVDFFKDYQSQTQILDRLSYAIENGYEDIAEFLVLNGEPIKTYYISLDKIGDKQNFFVKHPLITAIKKGYVDLSINMIKLIDSIDSINEYKVVYIRAVNSGWSRYEIDKLCALQAAIESPVGYRIIQELINSGINLNTVFSVTNSSLENIGTTPLILSISLKKL